MCQINSDFIDYNHIQFSWIVVKNNGSNFEWINKNVFNYNNWYSNEPKNYEGKELM